MENNPNNSLQLMNEISFGLVLYLLHSIYWAHTKNIQI